MSQPSRLPTGGRVNRAKPLRFSFDGTSYEGYEGDTVASALMANDVTVIGRSFKYHRPRGIVAAGAEEPNAILQVGQGAFTVPNARATQTELHDGLVASSVNCWPNTNLDLLAITGLFSRLLPAGFYYKTFMWPPRLWMKYEEYIRKAAGLGKAPADPDPDHYHKCNVHCDLLVVGAGPTGLAAALAAGKAGMRVILADEQNELGGSLLVTRHQINGASATEWLESAMVELRSLAEVRLLARTTIFGYYDHNFLVGLERLTDHLGPAKVTGPRQRLWRIRAKRVVLATGAVERPLVFSNNDLPGIMLANAVSTYVNRYAVKPGSRGLIFTNNDAAYQTVLDLLRVGVDVTAVVDVRSDPRGSLPDEVRGQGIEVLTGSVVTNARGSKRIQVADIAKLKADGDGVASLAGSLGCDFLAVSGGWSPAVHLHAQSGGKPRFDEERACFVPGDSVQPEQSAGACSGTFTLGACFKEGLAAGVKAAELTGFVVKEKISAPNTVNHTEQPIMPMWLVASNKPVARTPKQFVDLQNDTSAADIQLAAREGYLSIEHVKRYTALGFGTDQGKLGNINGMAILAATLGQDIPSTGTTTFRPAYTPVTFGAIAGRDVGELFDPVRKTAMHLWHVEHDAKFEDVGQWKRPWYYPKDGEDLHAAVNRECLATRDSVGILDASTLGKIDIKGPDAAELLNRVYTNAWAKLEIGRCRYGLMLGEDGMVMDDGVTTRLGEHHYHMTTTTGGAAHVLGWLEQWLQTEWPDLKVYLTSVTDHWATISVAGPNSRQVATRVCSGIDFSPQSFPFMSYREGTASEVLARVFRISFSGELAYEINVAADFGRRVWEACMEAGKEFNITPYGTEAMHVLRAEKGYIIVGQDTDGSVSPQDLGMQWIVSKNKDFLGKRSLFRADCVREDRKQLVGLLTDVPKEVLPEGAQLVDTPSDQTPVPMIGHVTSSYFSACLGKSVALALVKGGRARMGEKVYAPLAGGRTIVATISNPVFYDTDGERQRG